MARSRHFCCCIPVRIAVFFLSLFSFLGAGIVSAAIWWTVSLIESKKTVNNVNFGDIDSQGKIIIIVAGVLATIVTIISLFGFIGSVIKNRRMVKAYSTLVWLVVLLHAAGSGLYLFFVFSGKKFYKDCVPNQDNNPDICSFDLSTWQKIVATVITIASLIVQVYIATIIGRYKDQLYDEYDWSSEYKLASATGPSGSTYTPNYYPTTVQDNHGLLNPQPAAQYPYSDASNSFGKTAH